jgi:hypothetical protein
MADLLVESHGDHWRNPKLDLDLSGGRLADPE